MIKESELVVLVDATDNDIGVAEKQEAHVLGLRHRAISVLLLDDRGRALLQRRAFSKYHSGGLWTNACCGHPRPGERPRDAAGRRLREEMGIKTDLSFERIFSYQVALSNGLVENEIVHLFSGRFSGRPAPCDGEVEDWAFIHIDELRAEISEVPERYTEWFKLYIDAVPNLVSP